MTSQTLLLVSLFTGVSGVSRAEVATESVTEVSPRPPRKVLPDTQPWVLRSEMTLSSRTEFATFSLELERNMNRYIVFDASVGTGLLTDVVTESAGPTLGFDRPVINTLTMATHARAQLPIDARAIHSLFLGVGPRFDTGGPYGDLWHGQLELGYDARLPHARGLSLLVALGTEVALNSRAAPTDQSLCIISGCLPAVKLGEMSTILRLGIGGAF